MRRRKVAFRYRPVQRTERNKIENEGGKTMLNGIKRSAKRRLAIFLAVLMLMTCTPVSILADETDDEVATSRTVVGTDDSDASSPTAHGHSATQIVGTGPVADGLFPCLFLQTEETVLLAALHELGEVLLVGVDDS